MRIWSIHPKYLDAKGMVALWRETLLAKHVLEGRTKGYRNHPQLERFKSTANPLGAINYYLSIVWEEAKSRNYSFDREKIDWNFEKSKLKVTNGQVAYEIIHLMNKLKVRDNQKFTDLKDITTFDLHPLFKLVVGDIETWERVV